MDNYGAWLPLIFGGFIVVAVCFKVFRDPSLSNFMGYALVGAVALCALPTIQNFTYKGQLGELQANMKGDVANQSATLGADINDLKKRLDLVVGKLNITGEVNSAIGPAYQKNKAREVLVFYSKSAAVQADAIRTFLLDAGYKASSTYTDFIELQPPLPASGSIRLVYMNTSAELANVVRSNLRTKFPNLKEIGDRVVEKMNSGELQVQLF